MVRRTSSAHTERLPQKNTGNILFALLLTLFLLVSGWYVARAFLRQRHLPKGILLPDEPILLPLSEEKGQVSTGEIELVQEQFPIIQPPVASVLSEPPDLYEKSLDPADYEQNRLLYPHVKVFPQRQDALLLKDQLPYGWHLAAASRRGYNHAYEGQYRHDDFALRTQYFSLSSGQSSLHSTEIPLSAALIAIADGLGSTPHARYGAHAAVEGAVSILSQSLVAQKDLERLTVHLLSSLQTHDELAVPARNLARSFLCQGMASAQAAVQEMARLQNVSITALHSTLLLLLVIPLSPDHLFLASTQIGNGALLARCLGADGPSSNHWQYLQQTPLLDASDAVVPLLHSDQVSWLHFFRCGIFKDLATVVGITDGIVDTLKSPLTVPHSPAPDSFLPVEDFSLSLRSSLRAPSPQLAAVALGNFLGYRNAQSYDDRTVFCLYQEKWLEP